MTHEFQQGNNKTINFTTYKFNPIPMASVATRTLHEFLGSLNFCAWANFVLGGKPPYITATSMPLDSIPRLT